MDISKQVDTIVDGLVRQIQSKLDSQIEALVTTKLESALAAIDFEQKLNWLASIKLDSLIAGMDIDKKVVMDRISQVSDTVVDSITNEARTMALTSVRNRMFNEIDTSRVIREAAADEIRRNIQTFAFPAASIPSEAIQTDGLKISAANLKGGVISNFSSTGIEDKSTKVQMTLLDQAVVIENQIVSMGLNVKGTTVLEGDLIINGSVPERSEFFKKLVADISAATRDNLNTELFEGYSNVIFENIRKEGLDLNRITINGAEVIKGNQLNYGIVDSNLKKIGILDDLQVSGDTLLAQTLAVMKNRVGINTKDPGHALSVWDQEVEIGFGKRERDTAWINTPRGQQLIIGVGKHDNLIVDNDGLVKVKSLDIGSVRFITSDTVPNYEAPPGVIAWNSNPTSGSSIGWVSLGGTAWSRFGIIT